MLHEIQKMLPSLSITTLNVSNIQTSLEIGMSILSVSLKEMLILGCGLIMCLPGGATKVSNSL